MPDYPVLLILEEILKRTDVWRKRLINRFDQPPRVSTLQIGHHLYAIDWNRLVFTLQLLEASEDVLITHPKHREAYDSFIPSDVRCYPRLSDG